MKYLYTHDIASEGAKALAEAMNIKRIRRENSRFKGGSDKIVINWGATKLSGRAHECKVINHPEDVLTCSNKLRFFQTVREARTVPWTDQASVVAEWLEDGATVVARTSLTGSNAEGLVMFDATQSFVKAPLYTKYIKKKDEYRIHIIDGKIVDEQRKAIRMRSRRDQYGGVGNGSYQDVEYLSNVDRRIRNLANGFVFVKNDISPPEDVHVQALAVFKNIPLHFGAVDVLWNEKQQKAYVLEVNTAPGIEGSTITNYASALSAMSGE